MHSFRARAGERIAAGGEISADFGSDEMGILWQTDAYTNGHALHAFQCASGQRRNCRAARPWYLVHDESELDIDFVLLELRRVGDAQQGRRRSTRKQRTRELAKLEDQATRGRERRHGA